MAVSVTSDGGHPSLEAMPPRLSPTEDLAVSVKAVSGRSGKKSGGVSALRGMSTTAEAVKTAKTCRVSPPHATTTQLRVAGCGNFSGSRVSTPTGRATSGSHVTKASIFVVISVSRHLKSLEN